MKPDTHSEELAPLALFPGKLEVQEMKTARSTCISCTWRPCEPMVSSWSESPSHFGLRLSTSRKVCDVPEK